MNQPSMTSSPANGGSTPHDLFALTDEQILEIAPEGEVNVAPPFRAPSPAGPSGVAEHAGLKPGASQNSDEPAGSPGEARDSSASREAGALNPSSAASSATVSGPFSAPEDVRALAELYPGGVAQAKSAAERARTLDEIDAAYFGAAGNSPQQIGAARAQLAQRMLSEDPAAFREMVFAGLRALEAAGNQPGAASVGATLASPAANGGKAPAGGASPDPTVTADSPAADAASGAASFVGAQHAAPLPANPSWPNGGNVNQAPIAAYTAFEKAANEELERSVGGAIARTIEQALPNLGKSDGTATAGARTIVPLNERLSAAVRQDVEAALKGDRQLSEQIAQILAARRFDNETRAQVVRLIDERARQVVPAAAKRVIGDWTQTTLAAHRGKTSRSEAAPARREVEPLAAQGTSPAASSSRAAQARPGPEPHRNAKRSDAHRLDYRKLSDEQILEM